MVHGLLTGACHAGTFFDDLEHLVEFERLVEEDVGVGDRDDLTGEMPVRVFDELTERRILTTELLALF